MGNIRHMITSLSITTAILIIGCNILALLVVLGNPSMRTKPLYLLTLSGVCADLLMGAFVLPLVIRTHTTRQWHPCDVSMALQVTMDYLVFFISGWTLVTQSLLIIYRHTTVLRCLPCLPEMPAHLPAWLRTAVLVAWPWVVGVLLSVGVCVRYVHKHGMYGMYDDEDALCMLRLDAAALIAMNVACIMLPAVLLICATVILKGNMCRSPHSPGGMILLVEAHDVPSDADGDTLSRDTLANGGQHTSSNGILGTSENSNVVGETNTSNTSTHNGTAEEISSPNGVTHEPVTSAHSTPADYTPGQAFVTDAAGGPVLNVEDVDWLRRIWVPNTVYIWCVVPFVVWDLFLRFGDLSMFGRNHYIMFSILQLVFTFLFFGKSYLLTISWLALKPVRRAVVEDFKKMRACARALVGHQPTSTGTTVSFTRLTSDVQA